MKSSLLQLLNCPIIVGKDSLTHLKSKLELKEEIIIICDENSAKYCLPLVLKAIPGLKNKHILIIGSGEEYKTLDTCSSIWEYLTTNNISRNATIIGLGGGVIGDLSGFIAGVYKRGIRYYLIPTTLLAQTDASIGFKTGVDFLNFKNQLGLFYKPEAVIINPVFLNSLSGREFISGIAEIIKHGLIANKNILTELSKGLDIKNQKVTTQLLEDSIKTKIKIVTKDPDEKGLRKILNFGHSIGHALESFLLNKSSRKVLHGEAIAIGMICEAYISYKKKLLSQEDFDLVLNVLFRYFSKIKFSEKEIVQIINLIKQDKKNKGAVLNFSLITRIGKCKFNIPVTEKEIAESLNYYYEL